MKMNLLIGNRTVCGFDGNSPWLAGTLPPTSAAVPNKPYPRRLCAREGRRAVPAPRSQPSGFPASVSPLANFSFRRLLGPPPGAVVLGIKPRCAAMPAPGPNQTTNTYMNSKMMDTHRSGGTIRDGSSACHMLRHGAVAVGSPSFFRYRPLFSLSGRRFS